MYYYYYIILKLIYLLEDLLLGTYPFGPQRLLLQPSVTFLLDK